MNVQVNVTNQKLRIVTNLKTIVSGSQEFVKFEFFLDKDWDGLTIFAQFRQEDTAYNKYLNEENCVYLPPEIKPGNCMLMLYGTKELVIATTNYVNLIIDENMLLENAESIELTEPLYNQLVEKVKRTAIPHIGDNGNWWFDDEDTGVSATEEIVAMRDEAVEAVKSAGEKELAAIKEVGADQLIADLNTAGEQQTSAVNNAGTTQVQNVNTAGAAQLSAIENKGANTLASIPDDYTTLGNDVSSLKDQISEINDDLYTIKPLDAVFAFSGAASAVSDAILTAGNTYVITNVTDGVYGGLLYIDGFSSPSVECPAVGDSVNFTPTNSGALKFYNADIASGTSVTLTVSGPDTIQVENRVERIEQSITTVYEVGDGKKYASFVDCIKALPIEGKKRVLVYGGIYDIYAEIGGDAFVETILSSQNWRDVNPIIPFDTEIIGVGNVIFTFNPPDTIDPEKAVLLSCINGSGSLTVENITIECKNLRYAVHIEGSQIADYDNSEYLIRDCTIRRTAGSYRNAVIGLGLNYGCHFVMEDCEVISETEKGNSLLMHGNTTLFAGSPSVTIKNSMLIDNYMSVQLLTRANSEAVIPIKISNSYLQSTIYKTTSSGVTVDDEFAIKLLNCNAVSVGNGSLVQNLKPVERYGVVTTA